MHFNMRSLQKNIDKVIALLANLSETPDIIAISETKITYGQPIVNVDIRERSVYLHQIFSINYRLKHKKKKQ